MRAGRLRDIIHFGLMEETPDTMGGVTQTFHEVASVYGRAIPSASETTLDGDNRNIYSFGFESRWVSGIRPNMVMKLNDKPEIWTLRDVIDPSGRRERLTFTAEREVESAEYVPPPPEPEMGPEEPEEDEE